MWLLPSLDRPDNLARFFAACTAMGTRTPGMVLIDRADWETNRDAYLTLALPLGWHLRLTEGRTQGDKLREVWSEIRDCAWLGLIGDDCVPWTEAWDRRLVACLDHALIVSCNDGWQAKADIAAGRLGNCWIIKGALVRALDYLFPPGLHHLFVDDIWEKIGREAACWHCEMSVLVKHLHAFKSGERDATHRAAYGEGFTENNPGPDREKGLWAGDERVYQGWLAAEARQAVTLARALAGPAGDTGERSLIAVRQARVRGRKVVIGTPVYRNLSWQYTKAYAESLILLREEGAEGRGLFITGGSNLPKARNELCRYFLEASDADDLVMIDADMGWHPSSLIRLIASDKEVIGAVGMRKALPPTWCVRLLAGSHQRLNQDEMGAIEVDAIGTGFLKISRTALERIRQARPDLELKDYFRFFRFGEADEGEDYEFCALWRGAGGTVWADAEIELSHIGEHDYKGRFGDIIIARPADAKPEAKIAAD